MPPADEDFLDSTVLTSLEDSALGNDDDDEAEVASQPDSLGLVVISNSTLIIHPLPQSGSITIGRSVNCDITIDDNSISRRHALLSVGERITIEDLNSVNGTMVRGSQIESGHPIQVALGEPLRLGTVNVILQHRTPTTRQLLMTDEIARRLEQECARTQRSGSAFAMLHIEPQNGADMTVEAALADVLRDTDVLGRFGQHAYRVHLVDTSPTQADYAARRIEAELTRRGHTCRILLACCPRDGETSQQLIAHLRPTAFVPEKAAPTPGAGDLANNLIEMYLEPSAREMQHVGRHELPSEAQVEAVIELCRALMFPGYWGPDVARIRTKELHILVGQRLLELRTLLTRQVYRALHHKQQLLLGHFNFDSEACVDLADSITERFLAKLPELRAKIRLDVLAAFEGDPAASGVDEVLLCYPSIYAVTVQRIAHALLREGAVVVPRIMTELAHKRTGIDIHPGAEIGDSFFIDHGTGVVIGETTQIGNRVRVYQGVTLGALTVKRGEDRPAHGIRRHPTIEDDVVIYANATILGGGTVIGQGTVIGGNAFVTTSVAPGSKVPGSSRSVAAATPPPTSRDRLP